MNAKYLVALSLIVAVAACDDTGSAEAVADTTPAGDTTPTILDTSAAPDTTPPTPPLPEIEHQLALVDHNPAPDVVEVNLTAAPRGVTFFDDIKVEMYAYNGQLSGPLLQATVGDEIIVHFRNDLPEPTTIHWHGMRVPDEMDGSPRIQDPVPPGGTFTYRFVARDAGSYWYHPHVRSNEQVEKGLYGPIIIHEADAPEVDAERFLVLDDLLLFEDGIPPFLATHPEIMHGRTGNVLLINGTPDPVQAIVDQGTVERWRIVNTANARTMSVGIAGATWRVVGTDGGLLPTPYETDRLTVAVGQRYDLEVRYDQVGPVTFQNHVLAYNSANQLVEQALTMADFEVVASETTTPDPVWRGAALPTRAATGQAGFQFNVRAASDGSTEWTLNGEAMPKRPLYTWADGDVVDIVMTNEAGPEHPFHLHGQFFEIIGRNGDSVTDEPGLKDTVLVPGLETATVRAYLDNPGRWMAHCHILGHAELGMMAEFVVTEAE